MKKTRYFYLYLFFFVGFTSYAQDENLFSMMTDEKPTTEYTSSTFKSTRIINGHSVENVAAKHLDFRISHRFGRLNDGAYNFYGLDQATMRMGLEYGLTDMLMVGIGRSTSQKNIRLLCQI